MGVKPTDDELDRSIFEACAELTRRGGRSVSNAGFDAVGGRDFRVEIKTTTRSSISLSASGTLAERLIVVQLNAETGAAQIAYDGDAAVAWDVAGKPQKNGQRSLSLSKLRSVASQAVSETKPRIGRNQFDR